MVLGAQFEVRLGGPMAGGVHFGRLRPPYPQPFSRMTHGTSDAFLIEVKGCVVVIFVEGYRLL